MMTDDQSLECRGIMVAIMSASCLITSFCSSFIVKCLKNTPAYFAERLHKAMKVGSLYIFNVPP